MNDTPARSVSRLKPRDLKTIVWLVLGLVVVVIGIMIAVGLSSSADAQTADVASQGIGADPLSPDGASLQRAADGIRVRVEMPTPTPGSYEYPSADMVPPGSPEHPEVRPGGPDEPEIFTLWVFVFNQPELCTDTCNDDDLDDGAPAKGGAYQGDGRIADSDQLVLEGRVWLGQEPSRGSALENPLGAEVHIAIAPHGKALQGAELQRQLNGPIGNTTLWWPAAFPAD